jgi:asparagine synthase (glutamine-hydrolysing)
MCGIFFYGKRGIIRASEMSAIEEDFNRIKHRGPDESRVRYYNKGAMMGFHRLGIVDPTGDGMQPFETSRFACIINGEIYNYKDLIAQHRDVDLRSNSDCEIVVHLFERIVGTSEANLNHVKTLIEMLNGEFAFIIYDFKTENIFCGVDQISARPLFIGRDGQRQEVWIASEQKSLSSIKRCTEIIELNAGECSLINTPRFLQITTEAYLDYNAELEKPLSSLSHFPFTFTQAAERVYDLFMQNLELKSNPERQAGYLLSGGLDSSLVCGGSAKILYPHRIRTFTGGFDVNASDVQAARKVAKHINSIHTEYIFTYEEALSVVRDVIYNNESWDQTTTRASIPMILILRRIKKDHPELAVIYSGELADEMFMGYLEWKYAPSPLEARNHMIRRIRDVNRFDGRRADRCCSDVSCELRLPFFSKKLVRFVLDLPPQYLMPQHNNGVEKNILRTAFSKHDENGKTIIPEEILWRTKHAFSDATSLVGKDSLKEFLKRQADLNISDSRFANRDYIYPNNTPQTKEDMWYVKNFFFNFPLIFIFKVPRNFQLYASN